MSNDKTFSISYKDGDYESSLFLKGTNIKAKSILKAVRLFLSKFPDCEIAGIVDNSVNDTNKISDVQIIRK